MPPGAVLLSGVVGSTAYGLAHEDSDIDRLGTYAAPTTAFHGLHPPLGKAASCVTTSPDVTYHEAGKLAALLLKANPTVMELLWLDEYEVRHPLGDELIAIRRSFLSAVAVRNAFCGYATQQFAKLRARGDGSFSSDTRKRTAKHARHLFRLLHQGCGLHQTGTLAVRLSPNRAASCRAFGERIAGGDIAVAETAFRDAEEVFDGPGVLPSRPDEAAAEAWLLRVRAAFLAEPPVAQTGRGAALKADIARVRIPPGGPPTPAGEALTSP